MAAFRWKKNEVLSQPDVEAALLRQIAYLEEHGAPSSVEAPPPVSAPLVLIGSMPRSGGTLVQQLLDGHPETLPFPGELGIGYPSKTAWPQFDPDASPALLFATFFDSALGRLSLGKHLKTGKVRRRHQRADVLYAPAQHLRLFGEALGPAPRSRRHVLDAFFASLLGSWAHTAPVETGRWLVAHCPEIGSRRKSVDAFFDDYPDGRLICPVREPAGWFVSRRAHTKAGIEIYGAMDEQMRLWNKMARVLEKYRARWPDRVLVLSFEDLVSAREKTMRHMADWLGIAWDAALGEPTFEGLPVIPNTNFRGGDVLSRSDALTAGEQAAIEEATAEMRATLFA